MGEMAGRLFIESNENDDPTESSMVQSLRQRRLR